MLETNYLEYPASIQEAMNQQIDYVNTYTMDIPVQETEEPENTEEPVVEEPVEEPVEPVVEEPTEEPK